MTFLSADQSTDPELWERVRQGSVAAFEALVHRHQSLVAAVAYSACGDLTLSEDVAQETFWAAWREREAPEPPAHLRAWLCGVARNLGRNAGRRASRPVESAAPLDAAFELQADAPEPAAAALSREEEALVWDTLSQIPESYREPLILFYREGQSVAEVARALELTEDATKQRLSRGRAMLRDRISGLVEAGLRRTKPGRGFTGAVIAGLAVGGAGAKTASAAGIGVGVGVVAVAKAGLGVGMSAGAFGALGGLAGGWLGTWLPAQMAPTTTERDLYRRAGRRLALASVVLLAGIYGLIWLFAGRQTYIIALLSGMVTFQAYVAVEVIRLARAVQALRAAAGPGAEPNPSALKARVHAFSSRRRGRVYQSRARLFGWPLVDINVSDPVLPHGTPVRLDYRAGSKVARGWIAVGDHARGLLVAVGSTAVAPVAVGIDRALGLISFGGVAAGMVAVGGVAVGGVAVGGLGLGVLGIGGLGVGFWACGGGAVGWNVAVGGLAVAWHAAFGGGAFAHDVALGGGGWAPHFNDGVARAVLLDHPLKRGMDWFLAYRAWAIAAMVAPGLLMPALVMALKFRREPAPAAPTDRGPRPD